MNTSYLWTLRTVCPISYLRPKMTQGRQLVPQMPELFVRLIDEKTVEVLAQWQKFIKRQIFFSSFLCVN